MSFTIIIPTYNAGEFFYDVVKSIKKQSVAPDKVFIIDSSSSDDTVQIAKDAGFDCQIINKSDFNHGLTRQHGLKKSKNYDFAVLMTQDAELSDVDSLKNLLKPFENQQVSATYGRQVVKSDAPLYKKLQTSFNYPDVSRLKTIADKSELGLNTPFCSDVFACYRLSDPFCAFGKTNFGEDMLLAAKLLIGGKAVYYASDAVVNHSHKYSLKDEFKRGIEIGRIHKENKWLLAEFGSAESRGMSLLEGRRFFEKILICVQALPKYCGYVLARYF